MKLQYWLELLSLVFWLLLRIVSIWHISESNVDKQLVIGVIFELISKQFTWGVVEISTEEHSLIWSFYQ